MVRHGFKIRLVALAVMGVFAMTMLIPAASFASSKSTRNLGIGLAVLGTIIAISSQNNDHRYDHRYKPGYGYGYGYGYGRDFDHRWDRNWNKHRFDSRGVGHWRNDRFDPWGHPGWRR